MMTIIIIIPPIPPTTAPTIVPVLEEESDNDDHWKQYELLEQKNNQTYMGYKFYFERKSHRNTNDTSDEHRYLTLMEGFR